MLVAIDGQDWPLGGDILLEVQGLMMKPANVPKIREAMAHLRTGDTFKVKVLRAGRVLELTGSAP